MRRMLVSFLTVVLGLASVNSALAGFIAGANTRVALLQTNYSGGLVNKFAPNGANEKMVTTATSFVASPASTYSQALSVPGVGIVNVYLVAATGSPTVTNPGSGTFGVTFTNGETVLGVAGSNGWTNSQPGTMAANVWASHTSLQAKVQAALTSFFPGNATAISNAVTGVYGNGGQGIEIQGLGSAGNPDGYFKTLTSVSGTTNYSVSGNVNGLNEMSLVFTVVPEPTSLGLFGIGTLVVGLVRLRRKKS